MWQGTNRLPRVALLGVFAIAWVPGLLGAERYGYIGDPYERFQGEYTASMRLTGSFDVQGSLPPNLPRSDIRALVTTYAFFDGVQTLTESNSIIVMFEVATDSSCKLSEWVITFWELSDFIAGIDIVSVEAGAWYDDAFTEGFCAHPGFPCTLVHVQDSHNWGDVDYDAPSGPARWAGPESCPQSVFADGFEGGDAASWGGTVVLGRAEFTP